MFDACVTPNIEQTDTRTAKMTIFGWVYRDIEDNSFKDSKAGEC